MKRGFSTKITLLFIILFTSRGLSAAEIWVQPTGNDRASGSREAPKSTLAAALRTARELRRTEGARIAEEGGITIHLANGVYRLYEPIFIRPEDSGTPEAPTVIEGEAGAELSGGIRIAGWRKHGKLWMAEVPLFNGRPLDFRQLWINGVKADRARDVADFDDMHRILGNDVENRVLWVPAEAVTKIIGAPYAEMTLHEMWCVAHLRIKSVEIRGDSAAVRFHDPESRIQFEHPWPRPMVNGDGRNSAFYLSNAPELLDHPGEWYHDIASRRLYYMPRAGEDMRTVEAVVPAIETLVRVAGTVDEPVRHVQFRNLTFRHATWLRPSLQGHVPLQAGMYLIDGYEIAPQMIRGDGNHQLDNQGWIGRPPAAVEIRCAKEVNFENCLFEHLGASGLDYAEAAHGGTVERCIFRDIAGNGLLIGSLSPESFETHRPYAPADRRTVCSGQHVHNSLFTDIANEDWGCVAVCAGYAARVTIAHNEISEVSYTGISLGWGWTRSINCMHGNTVHANLIHHYAKHMYDTAGIYTLGAQPGTRITENAVHSIYAPPYAHDPDHWFYLYTDEGSSYITVRDNWTEGEKFLQNANGPGNVWEHNGPEVEEAIRIRAGMEKPTTK